MSILPAMLKAPGPDDHTVLLESLKWILNLGLMQVDPDEVVSILDAAYAAKGMAFHSIEDGDDRTDVRPLPFSTGTRLGCIHAPERLSIVVENASTRWNRVLLLLGLPKDGRAVPPGDREAMIDSMRECIAAARLSAHRVRQQKDPMGARLHLYWLRRAAACAALQAGAQPTGRAQPRISAPCPLLGGVGRTGTEFWRPTPTMIDRIEGTVGDVILVQAYEPAGSGPKGGYDLVIEVGPMQVRADPPGNPMEAMRTIAATIPAGEEWAELIP